MRLAAIDAEFIAEFPSYCRMCEAAGVLRNPSKPDRAPRPCPKCFEIGDCPRCRGKMQFASYCSQCGWDLDEIDRALPSALPVPLEARMKG